MAQVLELLRGRKTYIVAAAFLIGTVATAYANNTPIDWQKVFQAVVAMTIRAGIAKS